jgi:threonine aldolase
MVWLDLEAAGCRSDEFVELAKGEGLKMLGGRLVVHYQISDDAITGLEKLMDRSDHVQSIAEKTRSATL